MWSIVKALEGNTAFLHHYDLNAGDSSFCNFTRNSLI